MLLLRIHTLERLIICRRNWLMVRLMIRSESILLLLCNFLPYPQDWFHHPFLVFYRSDIWALGCLIYELCAWQCVAFLTSEWLSVLGPSLTMTTTTTRLCSPPFHEARTQAELTKLIRDGRIPNMPSVYSRRLQDVVKSMLQQDVRAVMILENISCLRPLITFAFIAKITTYSWTNSKYGWGETSRTDYRNEENVCYNGPLASLRHVKWLT